MNRTFWRIAPRPYLMAPVFHLGLCGAYPTLLCLHFPTQSRLIQTHIARNTGGITEAIVWRGPALPGVQSQKRKLPRTGNSIIGLDLRNPAERFTAVEQ